MNSKFHKMLQKKRDMSPVEKHAKMSVLKDLKSATSEAAGDRLGNLKKVSVMSDSDEGLQHGLQKAQDMTSPEDGDMQGMHDGGMAKDQEFSYADGGEVESPDASHFEADDSSEPNEMEEAEEALDSEDERHEDPSMEEAHSDNEFSGMNMDELDSKLRKLMQARTKMESNK